MPSRLRSRREQLHADDPAPRPPERASHSPRSVGWREIGEGRLRGDTATRATDECIELLRLGLALIEALDDEDYASPGSTQPTGSTWASPGSHTRHLLDFVDSLLSGVDARRVDYTARKRRVEIEASREIGCRATRRCIEGLERIRDLEGGLPLDVRPEPDQDWTRSSLARELQFVSAHAVHHHALIRMTLAQRGVEAPPEFGVAPSTLAYRAAQRGPNARDESPED